MLASRCLFTFVFRFLCQYSFIQRLNTCLGRRGSIIYLIHSRTIYAKRHVATVNSFSRHTMCKLIYSFHGGKWKRKRFFTPFEMTIHWFGAVQLTKLPTEKFIGSNA